MRRNLAVAALGTGLLVLSGCPVLKTSDNENISGRGVQAFDPYQGNSGAIRLALQWHNGCAMHPATGSPAGKGNANIPYPDNCSQRFPGWAGPANAEPAGPVKLLAGTNYFLNQLTFNETGINVHTDPHTALQDVPHWFLSLPKFGKLNWEGLALNKQEWMPSERSLGPHAWAYKIRWDNPKWKLNRKDSFLVEVIDAGGVVRTSQVYSREDFLAEGPGGWHTLLTWEVDNLEKPKHPGELHTRWSGHPPPNTGFPGSSPVIFQSLFKFELMTSTAPSKFFKIPDGLTGDGAIRVTWSQLPNDPFYVPVTYESANTLPSTCFKADDPTQTVPCTFGLVPDAVFGRPENGKFYVPGETVQVTLSLKDAEGNLLHPPDSFPSWNDYVLDNANGIVWANFYVYGALNDRETFSGISVTGPKHKMRPQYGLNQKEFFVIPTDQFIHGVGNEGMQPIPAPVVSAGALPGLRDMRPSTTYNIPLPKTAEAGTYVFYWKISRYFRGERFARIQPFEFQVGQEEETAFPNRVGNCQICHRSVLSLDNVRHGLSVDYVEGCKTCHNPDILVASRVQFQRMIHEVHMFSPKFPRAKNDCATCHLTRESALRSSHMVCSSCHPEPHGNSFESLLLVPEADRTALTNMGGNCAESCHGNTPPTQHILPAN